MKEGGEGMIVGIYAPYPEIKINGLQWLNSILYTQLHHHILYKFINPQVPIFMINDRQLNVYEWFITGCPTILAQSVHLSYCTADRTIIMEHPVSSLFLILLYIL